MIRTIKEKLVIGIVVLLVLYSICFAVFQIRNPLSNESAFYTEFIHVVKFEKLPEYQK